MVSSSAKRTIMPDTTVQPDRSQVRSVFLSAPDGLRLHIRDYRPAQAGTGCPVVCLPGLARTARDFEPLATAIASHASQARRVLALDYRGRGLSDRDADWRRYDLRIELEDVLSVLDALGISRAVIVGTSRGGLIAMAMAAARPTLLAGVVLNDIGPVIEVQGLLRIRGYVGRLPSPRNWPEAGDILRRISDSQFPRITAKEWEDIARLTWRENDGRLELAYDPALLKTVDAMDLEKPLPVLWHLFEGLRPVPVLAIRGEHSDILSEDTLDDMKAHHPDLDIHRVRDEGHAPLLRDQASIRRITDFIGGIAD